MNSKVYGLGGMYAPTYATLSHVQRYQHVRSIAVSHTDQGLGLPHAPEREAPARENANHWAAPGGALSRLPRGLGRSETCKQRGQEDTDMRDGKSRQPCSNGMWLMRLALGTSVTLASVPAYAQHKPNIILMLSDDFGYGDSGPYGGGPGRGMPAAGSRPGEAHL